MWPPLDLVRLDLYLSYSIYAINLVRIAKILVLTILEFINSLVYYIPSSIILASISSVLGVSVINMQIDNTINILFPDNIKTKDYTLSISLIFFGYIELDL
mgnify:CR=1 FL=1